jgi:hypothetical protein
MPAMGMATTVADMPSNRRRRLRVAVSITTLTLIYSGGEPASEGPRRLMRPRSLATRARNLTFVTR